MAHVLSPAGAPGFGSARRWGRRKGIDWRVVALTALAAVLLIAMMGRPA